VTQSPWSAADQLQRSVSLRPFQKAAKRGGDSLAVGVIVIVSVCVCGDGEVVALRVCERGLRLL